MDRKLLILLAILVAIIVFLLSGKRTTHAPHAPEPSKPTAIINNKTFLLEIANDEKSRERGLSYRKSLPQDTGMLFLFDRASMYSFWMKEMHFPIDIIYINDDTVVHVFENVPPPSSPDQELPVYTPNEPADKVLEINAGLSKKFNIKKGDNVKINLSQ